MFKDYPILSRIGAIFLDNIMIIFSYFIALFITKGSLTLLTSIPKVVGTMGFGALSFIATEIGWGRHLLILLLIVIIWRALLGYQEAYGGAIYPRFASLKMDVVAILRTVIIGCLIVISLAFFVKASVPKSLIVVFGIVNFVMLSIERAALYRLITYFNKKGKTIREILVLGTGEESAQFINSTRSYADWRVNIKGLICRDKSKVGKDLNGHKIIGYSENLAEVLHSYHVDELVIALPAKDLGDIAQIIEVCDKEGVSASIISPFFKTIVLKAKAVSVHGLPVISFLPVERQELGMALKRLIDITGSVVGLIILAPIFIVIAILIKLDSPGPVFYRWNILGLNKKPLTSYKFRTMVQAADDMKTALMEQNEMKGPAFKMKDDPRITKVGKWLRKYSLDELPQLWSVFTGDLSLVGPRPPLQTEMEKFEDWHRRKLSVKPGITCLWQISGRNEIKDFDEWVRLDLKYIDEWNTWLDIKILFRTVLTVFKGTGR